MKDEIPLGVVNEENEDECEQSTSKMTPFVQSVEMSAEKDNYFSATAGGEVDTSKQQLQELLHISDQTG